MKKRKLNSTNPKYYPVKEEEVKDCLLYTSDAADE